MRQQSARALMGWGLVAELMYVVLAVFVGHAAIEAIVGGVLACGLGWGLVVLALLMRSR